MSGGQVSWSHALDPHLVTVRAGPRRSGALARDRPSAQNGLAGTASRAFQDRNVTFTLFAPEPEWSRQDQRAVCLEQGAAHLIEPGVGRRPFSRRSSGLVSGPVGGCWRDHPGGACMEVRVDAALLGSVGAA